MGVSRKGLFRLALLILAIPVILLLTLHFFGENRMSVETNTPLKNCGLRNSEVSVHLSSPLLLKTIEEKNQLARVLKALDKKKIAFDSSDYPCFGDTLSLLMVDDENNLRGSYYLEHSDINRLFVELDIVKLQSSYGREVSR